MFRKLDVTPESLAKKNATNWTCVAKYEGRWRGHYYEFVKNQNLEPNPWPATEVVKHRCSCLGFEIYDKTRWVDGKFKTTTTAFVPCPREYQANMICFHSHYVSYARSEGIASDLDFVKLKATNALVVSKGGEFFHDMMGHGQTQRSVYPVPGLYLALEFYEKEKESFTNTQCATIERVLASYADQATSPVTIVYSNESAEPQYFYLQKDPEPAMHRLASEIDEETDNFFPRMREYIHSKDPRLDLTQHLIRGLGFNVDGSPCNRCGK